MGLGRTQSAERTQSDACPVIILGGRTLRGIGWTTAISYGGATLLGLLLIGRLVWPEAAPPQGLDLVLGAILLFFAGVVARATIAEATDACARLEKRAKAAEERLDQQRNVVDDLADGLDVAILICDPKATILYANRHSSELFRLSSPVGKTILTVTLSLDLEQLVLTTRETGQPQRREVQFTHPVERIALASAWPIDGGKRVIVSLYDVTDLRRLERIRSDFVSNVSHELRTPMASIRAMAETLVTEPRGPAERRQRYLERIISEVDRLSALSNDLLILSAAESNPVRKHTCDLAEIVRTVVQQLETKAREKGLKLEYRGPKNFLIEANTSQLTQVAINLIDNAINYTNDGGVDVSVEKDGKSAIVRVADTGIGIASEHVSRIFERFYRVDKARSRSSGGTGLGLSIVKNIVEAHGGRVSLESALGKGSTFTVVLPVGDVSGPSESSPFEP
ncbi:MAG: ATP-binding protein [Fimbriimonadaceae bacterium]